MQSQSNTSPERTVRLSFGWVVIAVIGILILGVIGGVLGQQILNPALPPLTQSSDDQVVTTVQQVTISPNTAIVDMIDRAHRSVMLLGSVNGERRNIAGSATVITNDGLLATTLATPSGELVAFDADGRAPFCLGLVQVSTAFPARPLPPYLGVGR